MTCSLLEVCTRVVEGSRFAVVHSYHTRVLLLPTLIPFLFLFCWFACFFLLPFLLLGFFLSCKLIGWASALVGGLGVSAGLILDEWIIRAEEPRSSLRREVRIA